MASNEIAERPSSVPALAATPAVEVSAEDIALPKLKIGQYSSDPVQDKLVDVGDLYTTIGQDDPEPNVIAEQGDEEGVLFHVLGMTKGKSLSVDGDLQVFDFNDPDAPAEAWVTYNYVVALPEVEESLPYKWLLSKSGKPAATQINLVLVRQSANQVPVHEIAFRVTTGYKENTKGKYYVPRVRQVEAEAANVEIAANLAQMISADPASAAAPSGGEDPAI